MDCMLPRIATPSRRRDSTRRRRRPPEGSIRMRPNHVLRSWRNGGKSVGAWLSVNSSFTAEAMAQLGFDWLCIDMQHGAADYADCFPMMQAISTTQTIPLVRVPWN